MLPAVIRRECLGLLAAALLWDVRLISAEPPLEEVLARAAQYVRMLQDRFASIVADERYEQQVVAASTTGRSATGGLRSGTGTWEVTQRRRLESELVLVLAPAARAWLAFRDVVRVDGRPVPDRDERLARVLMGKKDHTPEELKQIANESARFNIGAVNRNFNQPLLVVLFMGKDYQSHFTFEHAGVADIDGVRTWKIAYRERGTPTIITAPGDRDLPSFGNVWIEPATGRILRTVHEVRDERDKFSARALVHFANSERFGVAVPVKMTEEYRRLGSTVPSARATATYSNFRQFEVQSKLIAPQ